MSYPQKELQDLAKMYRHELGGTHVGASSRMINRRGRRGAEYKGEGGVVDLGTPLKLG